MNPETLVFNGIDGTTGSYLHPPSSLREARFRHWPAQPQGPAQSHFTAPRYPQPDRDPFGPTLRPRQGIDPRDVAAAGWAVIVPEDVDLAILEALQPLLTHRQQQTRHYRQLAYRKGETKRQFLNRLGAGPGPVDPEAVPYYLLLVGDPVALPYLFEQQLAVSYAIGRLCFETVKEYASYAHNVVEVETRAAQRQRRAVFFGVRHRDDLATQLTCDHLVRRIASFLHEDQPEWRIETVLAAKATKSRLLDLCGGKETPSFLFTASHGLVFPNGDRRQLPCQGALVCQDSPGPNVRRGPVPEDHFLSAGDIANTADLGGLITFHFACHGAGTPGTDNPELSEQPDASPPFVTRLPQRLLSRLRGALAVIGHVGRALGYSFLWKGVGAQTQVFEDTIKRLLEGYPVGAAITPFRDRYTELTSELLEGPEMATDESNQLQIAKDDARNYAVLGDPAVRLPEMLHEGSRLNRLLLTGRSSRDLATRFRT